MSSTQTMIVEGSAFNASSDITYTKPKVNASGGKNVGILNTTSKKSTYLSTPLMMTWGVNEYVDDKTGRRSYELSLQFPREQDSNFSNDTKLFLKNLIDFENKIKTDAISNSKDWMNKTKLSEEVVDALWTPYAQNILRIKRQVILISVDLLLFVSRFLFMMRSSVLSFMI